MVQNIFHEARTSDKAQVDVLMENRHIKIQRVVAGGHAPEANLFCPQEDHDVVFVLQGELTLEYEHERGKVTLAKGEYIHSAPKQNNRVAGTAKDTMWLKVSYHGEVGKGAFPSPDLKKLKEQIKNNVFRNTAMIESLSETKDVRLERVVSLGRESLTAAGECDQSVNEFVLVLKGETTLELNGAKHQLKAGDYTHIAPHVKNRVASIAQEQETIWLAVYFGGETGKSKYPYNTGY